MILPDIDGIEFCRQLRGWSGVPVIVLGTSDKTIDEIKCFDLGADDYVTRPLKINELIARIKVAFRHSKSDMATLPPDPFICNGIKVDFQKRQVFLENK